MPKKLDIEPMLTTLAPPSMVLALEQRLAGRRHPESGEEVDGHHLFEDLGVVLTAATGQVLSGVVDEHVESVETGGHGRHGVGVGQPTRTVRKGTQIAGRSPRPTDGYR